jgi:hypothetical protein
MFYVMMNALFYKGVKSLVVRSRPSDPWQSPECVLAIRDHAQAAASSWRTLM